jgi:peptide/nickel transport system permease protein
VPKLEYILRRLVMALFVLASVSVLTFFIARVVPSDPAAAWVGPHPTREQIDRVTELLGLDRPLYEQYLRYMDGLLHGNLGTSIITHQPIVKDIKTYLPATLELVLAAMFIAVVIGLPLGVLSGARRGSWLDHSTRLGAVAGVSIPTFWLGLILQLIFFGWLGILPLSGRSSTAVALFNPVEKVSGFYLFDAAVTGNWTAFWDGLRHLVLPAFTLASFAIGLTIRMTRSTMIETLSERYILAARAAGIPERTVLFVLTLKNAIIPTITLLGLTFVYSLTGAILVEVIFDWPGLGSYVTSAVLSLDFPVIVSVTLIVTMFYVVVNLLLDLSQAVLDPRISLR